MNYEKLSKYLNLKVEIRATENLIQELISINYDSERINIEQNKLTNLRAEIKNIVNFITLCTEPDVKSIMIYLFIENYTLEKIGEIMNMDRRTVSRKLHKYLDKNAHNAH